ncbi:metallophosphoesterase family protein [Xanthobacter sp. TB0136]|uniref:metallophosphoesterase family protein n=1 Tax=Xanthobacter sp. TB0136 TaxID=3459177 RepID=UPI004039F4CC
MFVLAHLSDPHLGPLPQPRTMDLVGKRFLGWMNWRSHRGHDLGPSTLGLLVKDLLAQGPDHICVSGDLTNLSLEAEFAAASVFLASLGPGEKVSVVPGNHDAYVAAAKGMTERYWAPFLAGDEGSLAASPYPYLRRRGPVAIVGLNSAIPTAPFLAQGRVGARQLKALRPLLERLGREGLFRVVMVHHPLTDSGPWHRRLRDAAALRKVLAEAGADLVIHGHDHRSSLLHLPVPGGQVPVVGVPSASAGPREGVKAGGYALYRISGEAGAWRCEMERRGFPPQGMQVRHLSREMLVA